MWKLASSVGTIAMLAAASASWAGESGMSGEEMRRAVAGRTVLLDTPVGSLPIVYQAGGGLTGKAKGMPAHLLDGPSEDHGRWWIASDQLCQQWSRWLDGRKYCFRMRVEGSTVHWRRDDGRTGTARIVSN
ncbi:MAG: hypothetical protein AB7O57_20235 [Hyphomicrobiaceae bacterium]